MAKSVLEIVFKVAREGSGDKDTQRELRALEKDFKGVMATMGAFAGAAAAVTAALKFSVQEAMEAEKQQAKLAAVLKSTGGAAGMTQASLNNLATELSRMSGIDDELIVSSEAVMLTFTQIGRQVFPEAMEAALNMNAVLGGDLQQSVVQLGKALNVTAGDTQTASLGLTAMRRSGVSFTEEQKQMAMQMVKTGDVIGYQKLILSELNTEFGGAAEAMGDTAAGSAEKLKNSIGNLAAAWGAQFLPSIQATNEALAESADAMTDNIEAADRHREAVENVADAYGLTFDQLKRARASSAEFNETFRAQVAQLERGAAMTQFYQAQVEAATQAQLANEESLKAMTDANKSQMSVIMQMQGEYTNYTEKNEDLRAKLAELTAEQSKVSEWSSKYEDYQGQIEETQQAIDQLATEHEMAGKRIAFSLLQTKMAQGEFTDQEMTDLVKIGVNWGLLDTEVAEAALNMIASTEQMAEALQDPNGQMMSLNDKVRSLKNLTGSSFDFYVNIHTSGAFPSFGGAHGGGGGSVNPEMMAGGGQLGQGWAIVGEKGPELVTPSGYVIPNEVSRWLVPHVSPEFKFGAGGLIGLDTGELLYGSGGVPVTSGNLGNTYTPGSSSSSSSPPPGTVTSEITQASQVANVVVPMAAATEEAVRTTQSVQQQTVLQMQAVVNTIQASNAGMVSEQRETNRLLRDNNTSLPRTLAAVIQQALP